MNLFSRKNIEPKMMNEEEKEKKITLDESSAKNKEDACKELRSDFVKISLSQLGSKALSYYFEKCFEKKKYFIKKKDFNA